ncbi:Protein YceI [Defluviimonas aquaemixtae]|uniref:Protein YceI n=1 Tax=Albidovulum aquaemixtae TaxID=1542388 RepID=A0A2R8B453_9RHOB|nr:YceI family protein [Defluviimonas aquaemixtae]SPH17273.1 Protein YceI [Defluviimonas aquaemixtae]
MKFLNTLIATIFLATPVYAAPQPYELQQGDSSVGFSWFLGSEEVRGSMPVAGADIVLDLDRLQNSKVRVSVDVAQARAGFPFASQGMKGKKVLWAQKYPQITFESTGFRRSGDGAIVDGNLTVRGVTRPATFTAQLFRQAGTEVGDRSRLSVRLNGSLSRAAFGANGWADMAGDEVRLSIIARMQIAGR